MNSELEQRIITISFMLCQYGSWFDHFVPQATESVTVHRLGGYKRVGRLLFKVYFQSVRDLRPIDRPQSSDMIVVQIKYRSHYIFRAEAPAGCDVQTLEPSCYPEPEEFSCHWDHTRQLPLIYLIAACQSVSVQALAAAN